jgi:hypothetical protein
MSVYIRVFAYVEIPSGFGSRKPVTRHTVCVIQDDDFVGKQVGHDMGKDAALQLAKEWADLLQAPVRYFKEKRVTTTTAEEVDELPKD